MKVVLECSASSAITSSKQLRDIVLRRLRFVVKAKVANGMNERKVRSVLRQKFYTEFSYLPLALECAFATQVSAVKGTHTKFKGACYYNALDYAHRNPSVELAVGYFGNWGKWDASNTDLYANLVENDINNLGNAGVQIEHGFNVIGKTVIDPTLGTSMAGDTYCFKIIPREVWMKFPFKKNDQESRTGFLPVWKYLRQLRKDAEERFPLDTFLAKV